MQPVLPLCERKALKLFDGYVVGEVAGLGCRRNGKKIPLCVNAFTLRQVF